MRTVNLDIHHPAWIFLWFRIPLLPTTLFGVRGDLMEAGVSEYV
jgi:hypothetical protein